MAVLRLDANLVFDAEDPAAAALVAHIAALEASLRTLEPPVGAAVPSRVVLHRCYHDEPEPAPCEIVTEWVRG